MLFVFVTTFCERNRVNGSRSQDLAPLWEVRSIPGNLIGVGKTPNEARRSAMGLIEWTVEEEKEPESWYRGAWGQADPADHDIFGRAVTDQHRKLTAPRRIVDNASYVPALTA